MDLATGFALHQFSEVLKIRDAAGQPYVLIGGQAVNYWAERYLAEEPELGKLQPFTSEDIDFKGGRDDVQRIARQLALPASYPPKVAITALSGFIPLQIGNLKTAIEVVRRIPGIPTGIETPAIQAEWEGNTIRVLDPISLLACKLKLAATVPQERRRDVEHLRILVPCVRAFLGDLLQQVEAGNLPARAWLKVVNEAMKLATSLHARRIAGKHGINWPDILPLAALARSENYQIRRFREQRLSRGNERFGDHSP